MPKTTKLKTLYLFLIKYFEIYKENKFHKLHKYSILRKKENHNLFLNKRN